MHRVRALITGPIQREAKITCSILTILWATVITTGNVQLDTFSGKIILKYILLFSNGPLNRKLSILIGTTGVCWRFLSSLLCACTVIICKCIAFDKQKYT